ncbi:hypothetical protein GCM10018954_075670 [Kutzneria kofuensis]
MEDAAESPVRVAAAGFEFDGGYPRCVGGVEVGAAELEPVDEQPDPVPAKGFDTLAPEDGAEFLDGVGAAGDAEDADLGTGVEGGEGVGPAAFHGGADGHGVGGWRS